MEEKTNDVVVMHTASSIDAKTRYENEYSTCCSRHKTDARLLKFASRFTLSIITLGFATIQIVRASPCDSLLPFYTSLITFVLGVWVRTQESKDVQLPS